MGVGVNIPLRRQPKPKPAAVVNPRGIMNVVAGRELRDRMDQHREVNWSAVAREAFERTLAQLEAEKPRRRKAAK